MTWGLGLVFVAALWVLVLMMVFIHFRLRSLESAVNRLLDERDERSVADRWGDLDVRLWAPVGKLKEHDHE